MADGGYDYLRYGAMDLKQIQVMVIGPASEFTLRKKPQAKVVKSEVK